MTKATRLFKPTSDDWYPPLFVGALPAVRVSYYSILPDGRPRIVVRGGDDFGMERDFASPEEAEKVFMQIAMIPVVTQTFLNSLNFVIA